MCVVGVSLQTGLSARGWRASCHSKIGLLHKVGAIAAYQNHPNGYESAPKPRQLPCRAARIRSLARALRELRSALCASATAPGEGGGGTPNSLNSRTFYAPPILSCGTAVSTAAAGQKPLQLREPKALLVVEPDLPAHALGGGQVYATHGFWALKYFVIDVVESRSRCRRLMRSCL
jgi:hypothetical protein